MVWPNLQSLVRQKSGLHAVSAAQHWLLPRRTPLRCFLPLGPTLLPRAGEVRLEEMPYVPQDLLSLHTKQQPGSAHWQFRVPSHTVSLSAEVGTRVRARAWESLGGQRQWQHLAWPTSQTQNLGCTGVLEPGGPEHGPHLPSDHSNKCHEQELGVPPKLYHLRPSSVYWGHFLWVGLTANARQMSLLSHRAASPFRDNCGGALQGQRGQCSLSTGGLGAFSAAS